MSSSCIEEVSVPDDNWYRIANELLSRAGIAINGSAPIFLNAFCRKVLWG